MFADIYFLNISSFIFKENHVLIEQDNPSEKNCYSRGIPYLLERAPMLERAPPSN